MENHRVLRGLVILLHFAGLSPEATYNFSLCNHEEIRKDFLNVLVSHMSLSEEQDDHGCEEESPETAAGPQQSEGWWRRQRAGRLLECVLDGTRGCGGTRRDALWRDTLRALRERCSGYVPPEDWQDGEFRRGSPRGGGAGLCDDGKIQELKAMWRSYLNLA